MLNDVQLNMSQKKYITSLGSMKVYIMIGWVGGASEKSRRESFRNTDSE